MAHGELKPSVLQDMKLMDTQLEVAEEYGRRPNPTHSGWVVRVDGNGRFKAVMSGRGGPTAIDPNHVVIATSDATVLGLVTSWAFGQLGDPLPSDAVVIVTEGKNILGVLTGTELREIADVSVVRTLIDATSLTRTSEVPLLVRQCRFEIASRKCGSITEFSWRPEDLPECRNDGGLPAHQFVW